MRECVLQIARTNNEIVRGILLKITIYTVEIYRHAYARARVWSRAHTHTEIEGQRCVRRTTPMP